MSISLAVLAKIQPAGVPKPPVLLYQNYRRAAPIVFGGRSYDWVPFGVESQPELDLQLSSAETMISIGRSAALDAILAANNDLKKAVVILYFIQPGTTVRPIGRKGTISHTTREGSSVLFTIRPSTTALRGTTITKFYSAKDFPNLPAYKPRL